MTLSRAEIRRRYNERHPEARKAYKAARQADRNCADCGEWSVHEALGLCRKCYKKVAGQRPQGKASQLARSQKWYAAHREEFLKWTFDKLREDPEWAERRRSYWRAYVAENAEVKRAAVKRWKRENPEHAQVLRNTRRARKLAIPSNLTPSQWIEILSFYGNRCVYCGKDGPMTMDHVTPLAKGGHHIAENVVPACRSCNSAKGALSANEFLDRKAKQ